MRCCKCKKDAVNIIEVDGKKYGVCAEHTPNTPPNSNYIITPIQKSTPIQTSTPIQKKSLVDMLRSKGFIAKLQGKEYVLFGGLLWISHENGLKTIDTEILEHDRENGFAMVKATVKGSRGSFSGIGDACPKTCGKKIASAYIRMAETRAVARALRFYTGIGMTAKEELPPQERATKKDNDSK